MTEDVTIPHAAQLLGISRAAVRRRLKSGELTGRQVPRPQGHIWLITLPAGADTFRQVPTANGTSRQVPAGAAQEGPPAPGTAILAQRAEEMATYSHRLLAPYVAQIAEQAEELGRVKAELEAARAQLSERAEAPPTDGQAQAPESAAREVERRPWWQRLLAWG